MKISREEVKHIAMIARLGIDKGEIDKFRSQLSNILDNFEILNQVDTTGLPPTSQSISLKNVFRDDYVKTSLPADEVLRNAPHADNGYFKIQAVLE
jgi:aspartyl-tRNA(Asn)/glutamyl-tRNA(Gln) amidotransferase subunit C